MLNRIAWRNIWRNRLRSLVVIISIILGVWAGLFVLALSKGLNDQRTENMINTSISHLQVHHPEYLRDNKVGNFIRDFDQLEDRLNTLDHLRAYSPRVKVSGMVSSSAGGFGVNIFGIDPEMESRVTTVSEKVVEGSYFREDKIRQPVVIGEALADKLNVQLHNKVVLQFQNMDGDIVAGAFRVAGIFRTLSSKYDEMNLFLRDQDIHELMGSPPRYHEVAVMGDDIDHVKPLAEQIGDNRENLTARTWKEISPELGYADDMMSQMMYIFIGIIMLALAFGIINTMLMAVLERRKELGMLMSIGMNRKRVFLMILLETVYLSLLSGPLGILFSYSTIEYFKKVGIDLSIIGEGLRSLAVGHVIYPALDNEFYLNIAFIVVLTAILSALYPAWKALRLKPAEAVRM